MSHTPGPWIVTDTRDGGYPGIMRQVQDEKGNITERLQVYPFYACAPEDRDFPRHSADSGTRAKRDHINPVGEHLITHSITEVNGKFNAVWFVGTRSDNRVCDTNDEADLFIQNGIRGETGFPQLGLKGGAESL